MHFLSFHIFRPVYGFSSKYYFLFQTNSNETSSLKTAGPEILNKFDPIYGKYIFFSFPTLPLSPNFSWCYPTSDGFKQFN